MEPHCTSVSSSRTWETSNLCSRIIKQMKWDSVYKAVSSCQTPQWAWCSATQENWDDIEWRGRGHSKDCCVRWRSLRNWGPWKSAEIPVQRNHWQLTGGCSGLEFKGLRVSFELVFAGIVAEKLKEKDAHKWYWGGVSNIWIQSWSLLTSCWCRIIIGDFGNCSNI